MKYAPVIIPTLNRYEHLKRCVESLKNNSLARYTDLFISVDYPPADKYMEGYQKVVDYVKGGIDGFREVHIYFQKSNMGASRNSQFLRREAGKMFDTYIFTEDDNVFSPCYLSYINQCLEKYKEDNLVYAVCGYSYPINWKEKTNTIVKCDCLFPAWGYATWTDKRKKLQQLSKQDIQQFMKRPKNVWKLYKGNRQLFIEAVHIARNNHYLALDEQKNLKHIDCVMGIYLIMKDMYALIPTLSLVRNLGSDGSGLHCARIEESNKVTVKEYNFTEQIIDMREDFSLEDTNVVNITQSERKMLNRYMDATLKDQTKAWLIWILYFVGFIKC